ncbi:MAG: hypothetical protein OHK0024_25300 [Thalassobaculales bacterium]
MSLALSPDADSRPRKARPQAPSAASGLLLWQAANAWQRRARAALQEVDLTYVQALLLIAVDQAAGEENLTQGALARSCGTDVTMTSQVLRTLERKALVTRRRGRDARSRVPMPTAEGRVVAQAAARSLAAAEDEFFGAVGALDRMRRALQKLGHHG